MHKKRAQCAAIAGGAFILMSLADPRASIAQSENACREEAHEFCRNLEPEHGTLKRCLQEHFGDLSSACRAHLQQRSERSQDQNERGTRRTRAPR
jgi:Cysteine rich repeat